MPGTTIGTRTRIEEWKDDAGGGGSGSGLSALDQLGNWTYHRRDLTGGATPNFSGTGEFKSKNYFDQANQWVKVGGGANRNIEKSTGTSYTSANYTHAFDAAGNWTDDNVNYTMAYDAWNRLVSVKNQSAGLLAEYSYNGLGWRTGWHDDINASGAADTSDPWYHVTYDPQWRPVATQRWAYNGGSGHYEPDTYVHERFLYHEARGGNPDTLIRRDTDANAWTSAAASTLTVAVYYCANWRGDTSVIVDGTPNIVERVKYSAYGVPFGLPAGDHDCDGDWDKTDQTAINAGTPYRLRADVNLDGVMGAADVTAAKTFNTVGRGQLSRSTTANRQGYAAYQHDHNFTDTFCHVRYRVLNIDLGRWLTRDPIGYEAGSSLYAYARNEPVFAADSSGLISSSCGGCKMAISPPTQPANPRTDPNSPDWIPGSELPIGDSPTFCADRGLFNTACEDCCDARAAQWGWDAQWVTACKAACPRNILVPKWVPSTLPSHPGPVLPTDPVCNQLCAGVDPRTGQGAIGRSGCDGHGNRISCNCLPYRGYPSSPSPGTWRGMVAECASVCEGLHQYNYDCPPTGFQPIWHGSSQECGLACSECNVGSCMTFCMSRNIDCARAGTQDEVALCMRLKQGLEQWTQEQCAKCRDCPAR